MASAGSRAAAQRAVRSGPSIAIPKGGRSPLPKVAGGLLQVRNDHKSNRGAKDRASGKGR